MISKQGLQVRLGSTLVATALGFGAAAFLAFAAYAALLRFMPPTDAALVMAAACLSLLLLTWLLMRVYKARRRNRAKEPLEALEQALQLYAGPALKTWIREHPDRAVVLSALIGVAAGYSPSANRAIQNLFRTLIDEEQDR